MNKAVFNQSVTITRPSNTTAYTAGDVIGAATPISQVETATVVIGGILFSENPTVAKKLQLASGSTTVWYLLETVAGYTPAAADLHRLRLDIREAA